MSGVRAHLTQAAIAAALVLSLAGCPDARVRLVVSTDVIDFGASTEEITFRVTKARSSRPMAPLVVLSSDPWIEVLSCTSTGEGCVSRGSLDPIPVRVRVNRAKMQPGENAGIIAITSQGAVTRHVEVFAFTPASPAFSVSTRTPIQNEAVEFANETQVAPGWTIESYLWRLGEGRTSTLETPPPQLFRNPGAFTISLEVTVSRNGESVTVTDLRENFIVTTGVQAPTARFTASTNEPLVDNPVFFMDQSLPGSSPIVAWEWDFGDGTQSFVQNPVHVFTNGGMFTVTLRVATVDGFDTTQQVFTVVVRPPSADFRANNLNPPVNITTVQFTDLSDPGSAPINTWIWDFGDGGASNAQNPTHIYTQPGTYSVSLTVISRDGQDTETKTNYITAITIPPTADFSVSSRRPLVGDQVTFMDRSDPGTAPARSDPQASRIDTWQWTITHAASGATLTSTLEDPSFTLTQAGMYDVSLTVTTVHGSNTLLRSDFLGVFEETALDRYVRAPDDSFNASYLDPSLFSRTIQDPLGRFTGHVQDLTSQTWRTTADVDQPVWTHWVTIIEPTELLHSTALLFITGGSDDDPAPEQVDPLLASIAIQTGSVVASINAVPNQPLSFTGDPLSPRTEDAIVAYTFAQFLDSVENPGIPLDEEWPILLPMTKAAVRAMDVVQGFLRQRNNGVEVIDDFVVSGASKRGWTTWLTAAVDPRVKAIAPLVYDALNFRPQIKHHFDVNGFFSEALFDYVEAGLFGKDSMSPDGFFSRFHTSAGADLLEIVDPYEYRGRYFAVPKLLINSTGDQFFLPDSAQFYLRGNPALVVAGFPDPLVIEGLPGEKKLSYIPNVDHGLGDGTAVVAAFLPWYMDILHDRPLPQFDWRFDANNRLIVDVMERPSASFQWRATSFNRDFRLDSRVNQFPPPMWGSEPIGVNFLNEIRTNVQPLGDRWTAYFVQVEFPNADPDLEIPLPHRYTTEVVVTPNTLPDHDFVLPTANFGLAQGSTQSPAAGQQVQFMDTSMAGSGPILRWLWNFGDGTTSRAQNPSHAYQAPGLYSVSLTVTTVHGSNTLTRNNFINVQP